MNKNLDLADTSIKTAGPEGNPFYNIHWLAKDDIENLKTSASLLGAQLHKLHEVTENVKRSSTLSSVIKDVG